MPLHRIDQVFPLAILHPRTEPDWGARVDGGRGWDRRAGQTNVLQHTTFTAQDDLAAEHVEQLAHVARPRPDLQLLDDGVRDRCDAASPGE